MPSFPPRRFGLNYVPSRLWYYCWNNWDADSVARDFDAISALGMDHLRVQLIWSSFQPNPTHVSEPHLDRLRALLALAAERNLDVLLCVLTGFLSGYRFLPLNVLGADVLSSPEALGLEKRFFSALLPVVGEFANWLGFDLGNEINVLANQLPPAQGDAWGRALTDWLRPQMAGRMLVNGVDHDPWFNGRTFSTRHLVSDYEVTTIHAWPKFTGCLERGGLDDPPAVHVAGFMSRLCHWMQRRASVRRPVWVQEFGCSPLWGSAEQQATYLRRTMELAVAGGADWFTWWCSHDVDRRFRFDPLEYELGLLTTDNQPKPLAQVFRELARDLRACPPVSASDVLAPLPPLPDDFQPRMHRELPPEQWLEQPLHSNTWEIFEDYLASGALRGM